HRTSDDQGGRGQSGHDETVARHVVSPEFVVRQRIVIDRLLLVPCMCVSVAGRIARMAIIPACRLVGTSHLRLHVPVLETAYAVWTLCQVPVEPKTCRTASWRRLPGASVPT